jgi:DNA-binding LytR/AlgR family response regulator
MRAGPEASRPPGQRPDRLRRALQQRRAIWRRRHSKRRPPPSRRPSRRLPVGQPRSGSRRTGDIYAVRANAHYTYVHDGEKEYFCTLSISALEARLDPNAFLRVHRSYIVSVDRIARVKRSGEAGIAELGLPVRCTIPIARAHYRQVKLRIGALAG